MIHFNACFFHAVLNLFLLIDSRVLYGVMELVLNRNDEWILWSMSLWLNVDRIVIFGLKWRLFLVIVAQLWLFGLFVHVREFVCGMRSQSHVVKVRGMIDLIEFIESKRHHVWFYKSSSVLIKNLALCTTSAWLNLLCATSLFTSWARR